MEEIAEITGGQSYEVEERDDIEELDEVFNELTETLESRVSFDLRVGIPEP